MELKRRLVLEEKLLKVVAERKGEFLSSGYLTSQTKYKFKCLIGHTFDMSANKVLGGSWCQECSAGLYERLCREHFEQMFKLKFPKKHPKWLNGLELDGYCEALNLAFEYNGGQHYRYISFFHKSEEDFNKLKIRDKVKAELCKKNGVRLIVIPEMKRVAQFQSLVQIIKKECSKIAPEILKLIQTEEINPENAYLPPEIAIIAGLKVIAESKDGELRSNIYLGCEFKMLFYCNKHQYEWEATPYTIQKGHWCPVCGGHTPRNLEDCHKLAKSKNGKCLAEEYKTAKTKMPWKCEFDSHPIFYAIFDSVNRGTWCMECGKISIAEAVIKRREARCDEILKLCNEHAEKKGGKCLMKREDYINCNTKVLWKCSKDNHKIWESTIASVTKLNTWCPECKYEKTKANLSNFNLAACEARLLLKKLSSEVVTEIVSEIIDAEFQKTELGATVQQEKLF